MEHMSTRLPDGARSALRTWGDADFADLLRRR
jgi:hypothetical protein